MKKLLAVLAVALVLAGCGSSGGGQSAPTSTTSAPPKKHTIRGFAVDSVCIGEVNPGDTVEITDGAGKELAVGQILGETEKLQVESPDCAYDWEVKGVPEGASGYMVAIGKWPAKPFTWRQILDAPVLHVDAS